jgi:hypothetical protein
MNIQTIFVFQIITDLIFCLIIFFLLARLRGSLDKNKPPVVDPDLFLKLQDLISQSQNDSEKFIEILDESCRRLNDLSIRLENRANNLTALLKEADARAHQFSTGNQESLSTNDNRDYDAISRYLTEGFSAGEIAARTGLPLGEILLIVDLKRLKKGEQS